jgi:hypothetical protein
MTTPEWIPIVTLIVTAGLTIFGLGFTYANFRLAAHKYRADLFDKRFEAYGKLRAAINDWYESNTESEALQHNDTFLECEARVKWLFNRDEKLMSLLAGLRERIIQRHTDRFRKKAGGLSTQEHQAMVARAQALALDYPKLMIELDAVVDPYLTIHNP